MQIVMIVLLPLALFGVGLSLRPGLCLLLLCKEWYLTSKSNAIDGVGNFILLWDPHPAGVRAEEEPQHGGLHVRKIIPPNHLKGAKHSHLVLLHCICW